MKKVAIFDIDGTIFRSSLLIELTEALIEGNLFPQSARYKFNKSYQDWLDRKGTYDAYINDVVKAFLHHIKKMRREQLVKVSRQVIAFHKNRTYVYTRKLIDELKKKKYYLLAISNSPKEILDEFCSNWGFDKVYGRVYEVGKDGRYTGKILYLDQISDKSKILKRFIEKENFNLADSYGVGDSESDIKFLTFVENPICFNPNSKLYEHGSRAGWKIVVERKDVVYEIK